jgi:Vacuole effluxer Atg22 like
MKEHQPPLVTLQAATDQVSHERDKDADLPQKHEAAQLHCSSVQLTSWTTMAGAHAADDLYHESQAFLPEARAYERWIEGDSYQTSTSSTPLTSTRTMAHLAERSPSDVEDCTATTRLLYQRSLAPDEFLLGHETSRWEVWAYFTYYVGNNGLGLYQFASTAFQNLLAQAASEDGTLQFAGAPRTVSSILLLSNGISFSIQVVLFLVLGSFADFGTWRPSILIVLTVIGVAVGFAWLGVHTPDKWQYGAGLYIVGRLLPPRAS